jgi:hypothetical protein
VARPTVKPILHLLNVVISDSTGNIERIIPFPCGERGAHLLQSRSKRFNSLLLLRGIGFQFLHFAVFFEKLVEQIAFTAL